MKENNQYLKEILETTKSKKNETYLFNTYKSQDEVGINITKDLLSKYRENDGFVISDSRKEQGIVTDLQGLMTAITLLKYSIKNEVLKDVLPIIEKTVVNLLNTIYVNNQLVSNATPYFDFDIQSLDNTKIKYVDTAAKTLKSFVELRTILIKIKKQSVDFSDSLLNQNKMKEQIDQLIIDSLKIINAAAIELKTPIEYKLYNEVLNDINGQGIRFAGWNFAEINKEEYESVPYDTSYYFTYIVTDAYLSVYESFQENIHYNRLSAEDKKGYQPEDLAQFKENATLFEDPEFSHEFTLFNKRCLDAGRYIEQNIRENKIDITTNFLGLDFESVSYDDIEKSTVNDALFYTLFAVNIMIAAGVDIDYRSVGKEQVFYEYVQNATQNIQKSYKKIEEMKKVHIVDQFELSFNEQVPPKYQSIIKNFRKQRVYVASLMPLLIKVHAVVSKYVIKYPQKQMVTYLEYIMNQRCKKEDEIFWLWDEEEFNIHINLLYIEALGDFYDYYNEYEAPFLREGSKFKQDRLDKMKHDLETDKAIALKLQKESFEKKITELESKNEMLSLKNPLIEILEKMISVQINENLEHQLSGLLEKTAHTIFENQESDLTKAIKHLITTHLLSFVEIDAGYLDAKGRLKYNEINFKGLQDKLIEAIIRKLKENFSLT